MTFFTKHGRQALLLMALVIVASQSAQAQRQQNYTGDGGKEISLTIYVPQSTGLAKDQNYIPALVQGEFVSNFSNYSAISILDWERLDDIYVKLVNEAYDDKAAAKQDVVLGRLAPTSHFLTGNITKTKTGYNIKMNITNTADKMTVATYSGTFSFAELDNLTGIRRASLELLQKVGVSLTEEARKELAGAAEANQISAQTALAKGVTAQRAGTEVAALSYYFQAASFNPALKEAVKRSTIVAANISSGNLGADLRNDILWRKKWMARLKETGEANQEMITMIMNNAVTPPYTLIYFTDIKMGNVNYQMETADFSITTALIANWPWFATVRKTLDAAAQATQAVLDGLNATNRKEDWGLAWWPPGSRGVEGLVALKVGKAYIEGMTYIRDGIPFPTVSQKEYDITVVFELVNQRGRVIGSQTVKLNPTFNIEPNKNGRFIVEIAGDKVSTVTFKEVKADNISDNLTIRVASINGVSPQQARFAVTAMPMVKKTSPLIDVRDGKTYNTVRIGGRTWMAKNLNYQPSIGNSWCYQNDNSYCNEYGRLYDWNTAKMVCPTGWHLSTWGEWENLIDFIGRNEAGKKLNAKSGWGKNFIGDNKNGTDDYGFSALPGGFRSTEDIRHFENVGSFGYWWTSTESHNLYDQYFVYGLSIGYDDYRVEYGAHFENNLGTGLSVRCVED